LRARFRGRYSRIEAMVADDLKHRLNSPLSINGVRHPKTDYRSRVVEMSILKDVVQMLSKRRFEETSLSEVHRRTRGKGWGIYYSLILRSDDMSLGYGALIYISELKRIFERSGGVVLAARYSEGRGGEELKFEWASFDNYLVEVKPHMEMIYNLYCRTRRL